jgi:TldD protein
MQLQIHESTGHPTELDRVLDYEAAYAGTSHLRSNLLGANYMYGNSLITLIADATISKGLGTYYYDHEGVKAQKVPLVEKGELVGFMSSRETAKEINQERSSGAARAMGYNFIPLVRMTNVNLLPGDWSLDELIEDTKDGYFFDTNKSWSIDDLRLNFQFGCEIGWRIKNGEITHVIKNPTYTDVTPRFWRSCSGIANEKHWKLFGTPNCGKGEPGQAAYVGHGSSPSRFEGVKIGIVGEN